MFCEKCGKEIDDNSKFCMFCGMVIKNKAAEGKCSVQESNIADEQIDAKLKQVKKNKLIIGTVGLTMIIVAVVCILYGRYSNSQYLTEVNQIDSNVSNQNINAVDIEGTIQENIVINPGDTVTGIIEKRFLEADELVGGMDSEYYVLVFQNPVDLTVCDIEQGGEYIVEDCNEIAIVAPQMGNMGNIDLEPYVGSEVSCWLNASETGTRLGMIAEVGNLNLTGNNSTVQENVTETAFVVSDEIKGSNYNTGMIQIGKNFYYLGEKLSTWTDKGLSILSNTTAYDDCVVLGIEGEPICRLYVDDSAVMLEDATVTTICFGILYDSTITQSNAENVLNNPASIVCAGGIYLGMDYDEIEKIIGSGKLEETSDKTIVSFKAENGKYFLDIDRITGNICGIAYGDVRYW